MTYRMDFLKNSNLLHLSYVKLNYFYIALLNHDPDIVVYHTLVGHIF